MRRKLLITFLSLLLILLSGCGKKTPILDKKTDLDFLQDDSFDFIDEQELNFAGFEDFEESIKEEKKFKNHDKLISIILTAETAVRDALFEIAQLADLEIEIDPEIDTRIMVKFIDRPLSYVLEKISDAAGIIFDVDSEGIIRFRNDNPYLKNYHIDFLNLERSTTGKINIKSSGDAGGSTSDASISSSYDGKMWEEIKENIEYIIKNSKKIPKKSKLKSLNQSDDIFESNGKDSPSGKSDEEEVKTDKEDDEDENKLTINYQAGLITIVTTHKTHKNIEKYINQLRQTYSLQVMIEAKIVEVNLKESYALGIDWSIYENPNWMTAKYFDQQTATAATSGSAAATTSATSSATDPNVNKGIDAARGMNMKDKTMPIAGLGAKNTFKAIAPGVSGAENLLLKIFPTFGRIKIDTAINMLNKFGSTKTISSPRVIAMNNQQAVISFVKNHTYFTTKIEENSSGSSSSSGSGDNNRTKYSITSEQKTVPIGVILNILPSINPYKNEIMINVRPTISKITDYTIDPAESYLIASSGGSFTASKIPIVELKEMDSILKIRNGEIIVIGGMHETRKEEEKSRLPGVSKIPIFGGIFKSKSHFYNEIETVIFLRATILNPDHRKLNNRDYDYYNQKQNFINENNW